MKSKLLVGVSLFAILTGPQSAMAFCEDCWFNVGVKAWSSKPDFGDGKSRDSTMSQQQTLTAGYGKFFINVSSTTLGRFGNSSDSSIVEHGQSGLNLGYIPIPDLLLIVGNKALEDSWVENPSPKNWVVPMAAPAPFRTFGASYNYGIAKALSLNAGITYGTRNITADSKFSGSQGGASSYISYDIGTTYEITRAFKANIFYRLESWDTLVPTTINNHGDANLANLEMKRVSLSGLGAGVSYSF